MAQTLETYVSNGSQTIYTFNFDYIQKEFVKVQVEGQDVPFTLTGVYQVTLNSAPENGATIIIKRETATDRLVTFVDGSVLVAQDLNLSALQATHIAAEALDAAGGSLLIDETGAYTAGFRRITNVGDPVNDKDAVTKEWVETANSSSVVQAANSEANAFQSANDAQTWGNIAANAASLADADRVSAEAADASAKVWRDQALSYRNSALTARDEASVSATSANDSEIAAAASAAAAAQSALDAATFDPTFYVRNNIESVLNRTAFVGALNNTNSAALRIRGDGNTHLYFTRGNNVNQGLLYHSQNINGLLARVYDINGLNSIDYRFPRTNLLGNAADIVRVNEGDGRYLRRDATANGITQGVASGVRFSQPHIWVGNQSGNYQITLANSAFQSVTATGALNLLAPGGSDSYCIILNLVGSASMGAVSFTSFNAVTGDTIDPGDNKVWRLYISRSANRTHVHVVEVT